MMIDPAARAVLIAALEKISAARSGRIRYHGVPRASAAATYGADRLSVTLDSDLAFNNDQPAMSFRSEASSESDRDTVSTNRRVVVEKRFFLAKALVYDRTVGSGGDNDQDDDGVADEPDQWDSGTGSDADLWTVLDSEILGVNLAEQVPPAQIHFAWLIAALSDPTHEVDMSTDASGQALYTTSVRADQLADGWEELGQQYRAGARFGLRLSLSDGQVVRFILDTPPDTIEGFADLYESFEQSYWRMNEPITIAEPSAAECRPLVPPIHTVIAGCHLEKSNRYLSFEWGGRECTDRIFWKDEYEEPYVPLAVGDKLRVTGSTRPYYRTKSDKTVTATIWAAATADGQTILEVRPLDRDEYSPRFLNYYDRATDIVEQEVILNDVAVIAEPMQIRFAAPIRAEDDPLESAWTIEHATAVSLGLAEDTPVIVRAADTSVGRVITRVLLEDGTPIPGEWELIDREVA